jgi:hypothetical protein
MAHITCIELMGIGRYGCFKSAKRDGIPNMHDSVYILVMPPPLPAETALV